jgi:hypothetical protein
MDIKLWPKPLLKKIANFSSGLVFQFSTVVVPHNFDTDFSEFQQFQNCAFFGIWLKSDFVFILVWLFQQ